MSLRIKRICTLEQAREFMSLTAAAILRVRPLGFGWTLAPAGRRLKRRRQLPQASLAR